MADFAWLRIGQRPRTPSTPKPPVPPERGPPRKPSHLSLKTRTSSSPDPLAGSSDTSLLVRDQDRIWYNPSLDQMVEALQVELMSHGVMHPVPVHFNSYILHLIEGFVKAQERVRAVRAARAGAEQSLEKHLEHFKSVADEWLEREAQYKAEIKRLEVLLSRASSDGLEAVALARTNSVIDRSGPQAKQFVSELKRISMGTIDQTTPSDTTLETGDGASGSRPVGVTIGGSPLEHHRSRKSRDSLFGNLNHNNDFLVSERIRRAPDLAESRLWDRRARELKSDALVSKRGKTLSTVFGCDAPLFSDDIYAASDTSDKVELGQRGFTDQKQQPSRQILESLLDCEGIPGDEGENVGPPPRSAAGPSVERSPDHLRSDTTTHDLDSRHSRGLSGFSFVSGDDAFTTSVGDSSSSERMRAAALGRDGGNDIELRLYEGATSQHTEDDFARSRESRSPASSADTVIWADRKTTMPDTHYGSPIGRRTDSPLFHRRTMEGTQVSPGKI
ncbi:hypothetical protein GGR53DRAFT_128572 [Hypoxylon sp. FL1150]|nr:hypothetical protein GGR53DRAFT_128572 [Hypoxylon sp. FL1150]